MRYQIGDLPVPGYKLDSFLGAGAYGEVWKAVGPGGVPCALKFISLDNKAGLKEFRSIRLVKRLQHPNLCPVQAIWLRDPDGNVMSDSGEDSISFRLGGQKELVIAMGLGQKSLTQRLEECRAKGGVPPRELLKYMTDAARGIDYLNSPEHDLGDGPAAVIHCDIKPANLLIVGGGVQVCDYGVAKALAPDVKKTFAAGTPAYAPPELINNEPCAQTDQYSLAIAYYELRTGHLPFDENRALVANLMGQLDFADVGPDEQEVLRQATSKQPTKRFENCEEFVEALKLATGISFSRSEVVKMEQTRRAAAPPPDELTPTTSGSRVGPSPIAEAPSGPRKTLTDLLQPGGELVPDHYLTKRLGSGGYGEVWEAEAPGGVRCALKIVRDLQGRGKHEFGVLDTIRDLSHPYLIQLRGYWLLAADGSRVPSGKVGQAGAAVPTAVVVSTDLAEKNLLDRLQECQRDGLPGIPADELVGYARLAASALDYLNIEHSIQHRDIKPENLLLRNNRLLVSDFGLAKLVEGDGGAVQSSSSGMTLEYAAPELLQKRVSGRTDQYSLALTYYTLRTGRTPFPAGMGQYDTMQARIRGQLDLSGVADPERAVLRKALSPNPADRFASCGELARELSLATGVGSGPMPTLPQSGVVRTSDLYHSTPTPGSLPALPDPPAGKSGPYPDQADARTRSGLAFATPRPSGPPPAHVPLAAASNPPAGTILFGDGPAAPPPKAAPVASSATPWKEAAPPPARFTDDFDTGPGWKKDGPRSGGGAGRVVAIGAGVLVALGLIGAGVYIVSGLDGTTQPTTNQPDQDLVAKLTTDADRQIDREQFDEAGKTIADLVPHDRSKADELEAKLGRKKRDAVARRTGEINQLIEGKEWAKVPPLLDKLGGLDRSAAAPLRTRFDNARKSRIAELESQIRKLDPAKGGDRFAALIPEVADLDPAKAGELRKWWEARPVTPVATNSGGTTTQTPTVPPDNRLADARKSFKDRDLAAGLAKLDDVLKTTKDAAARRAAGALKDEWTKARTAHELKGTGYPLVADYRKAFPMPAAAALPDKADWDDLTAFRKSDLAEKVKAAVPGLDGKTDWKGLADACREAEPTEWVGACLTECRAELTRDGRAPDFRAPAVAETDADGYGLYAKTVDRLTANLAKDPKPAADDAADLVETELKAGHKWANDYRFGRLAHLLAEARKPYRARDDAPIADFAKPYQKQAERVSGWLIAARKAAKKANIGTDEINYELTLAEGCMAQPNMEVFTEAAKATAGSDYLTKQDRLAQTRFWVFHARTQTDRKAELADFSRAFDLLQAPGAGREAQYAYTAVVKKLRSDVAKEAGGDQDGSRPDADVLADVARKLAKNKHVWAKWNVPEGKTPDQEAVELLLLAHRAKVKVGNSEKAKALGYAREAAQLADEGKDLPAATRAEAYATLGWFLFDDGYAAGPGKARSGAWEEARGPLGRAVELAPKDARAWRWQFALGTVIRSHWELKAVELKTEGGELSDAQKLEMVNDDVRAANLVRRIEGDYAYKAFSSPDPAEKAAADLYYKERPVNYGGCKVVLDAAVKNPALADAPELPLWKLTAAELEFAIPAEKFMTVAQKMKADELANETEQSLDKIKSKELRETAKEIIKRVRRYKSQ